MDTSRNMLLITTADSAVLLPTIDRASKYAEDMMRGMLDTGVPVSLTIQQRSAGAVAQFLANTVPVAALAAPLKVVKPAKETVPAGKLPKAGKIKKAAPPPQAGKEKRRPAPERPAGPGA